MKAAVVIPIYEHKDTIRGVLASLAPLGLPCFVVNDGSGPATRDVLDAIAKDLEGIEIEHHPVNEGKGAALRHGFRLVAERGFTHALQLDADGQHDAADATRFLEAARSHPRALVLGQPIFDASAPRSRLYGRKLSIGLVWLATLSRAVRDPLCGFRCVPLAPALAVMDRTRTGDYMDFEPELAVRMVWAGVPVVNVPTRVRYFRDGISHFDLLWDDLRLAWLYVRLVLGMLVSLPAVIARRLRGRPTWEAA